MRRLNQGKNYYNYRLAHARLCHRVQMHIRIKRSKFNELCQLLLSNSFTTGGATSYVEKRSPSNFLHCPTIMVITMVTSKIAKTPNNRQHLHPQNIRHPCPTRPCRPRRAPPGDAAIGPDGAPRCVPGGASGRNGIC